MRRSGIWPSRIITHFVLLATAATAIYPFIFMLLSSLKEKTEYYVNLLGLPQNPSLLRYEILFDKFDVGRMLFNSVFVNGTAVFTTMFLATMTAYVFVMFPTKFGNRVTNLIISSMMIPSIVLLIPVYYMMAKANLVNNYLSLIIVYIALMMPFSLYFATTGMKSIPDSCIEAAMIDGASVSNIYFKIVLPMIKPVMITLFVVNFLWSWNELLYAMLLLQTNEMRTMTVGVATIIGKHTVNMPMLNAGLLINSLPVIVLFAFTQKYFLKGLTAGAVKE